MQTLDPRPDVVAAPAPAPPAPLDADPTNPLGPDPAGSVARNTLIMLVSQMVTFAMTFIWTVAIQRVLGKDNYGQLFTAQSLAWIGAVFMDAGVATFLTKQVARDRAHAGRMLSTAVLLRTASTAVVYAALLGVALAIGRQGDSFIAVVLVGLAIVVASFTQACAATFQGTENMLWPALGTIAEKVTVTVVSVTLLLLGYGLLAVAGVMLLGALVNLALIGTRAVRTGWVRLEFDRGFAKLLLAGGAPFFLWAAFGVIYQRNAGLQLAALTDDATAGQFGVAVRMYETLSFVPYIFQAAVLPVLSRTFVDSGDAMARTARRSLDLIVLAGLPVSAGVLLLAPQIISLTAGLPKYADSVVPLRILGLGLVPLYVDMILATILISADKQRQWAIVAVSAALINPLFNWWLIRQTQATYQNGAIGSAIVTFGTELAIFFVYVALLPRGVLGRANVGYAARVLVATGLMAGAILLVLPLLEGGAPGSGLDKGGALLVLAGTGVVGAAVFAGAALGLRLVGPEEVRLVRRALRRGAA
ncbi:MAG TPA: flippase [Chloroflexia bacterium]|nr:flippase [Chloroflexia bacterium]